MIERFILRRLIKKALRIYNGSGYTVDTQIMALNRADHYAKILAELEGFWKEDRV